VNIDHKPENNVAIGNSQRPGNNESGSISAIVDINGVEPTLWKVTRFRTAKAAFPDRILFAIIQRNGD
jgi:hypothetical protein